MAQELKTDLSKAGEEHAGKRRHMLRRFAKARRYAADLQAAADAAADARTRLEACAYSDYVCALELFEKARCSPRNQGLLRGQTTCTARACWRTSGGQC